MRTLGRISAIMGMFVSVLVLVLCLSGLVAIWIVRSSLATEPMGIDTAAETRTTTVKQELGRLDTAPAQARSQFATVEQDVKDSSTELQILRATPAGLMEHEARSRPPYRRPTALICSATG